MLRIMLRLHYASAAVETVALICFFFFCLFFSHLLFTSAFSFGGKRSGTWTANGGMCMVNR